MVMLWLVVGGQEGRCRREGWLRTAQYWGKMGTFD